MNTIKCQTVLDKFRKIHGDKFDYSKVIYHTAKTKVVVTCKEHGDFLVTPNNHLLGNGCPKCRGRGFTEQEKLVQFITQGHKIHNSKYDYSKVVITDPKLTIICPVHGEFSQLRRAHIINKSGCPDCGVATTRIKNTLTKEEFIQKAERTHNNRYTYDNVIYEGAHKKVNITCTTHGDFTVTPANHWSNGIGCPSCFNSNPSKGEVKIMNWLSNNGITAESQKTFPDLYYKAKNGRLRYDFYVPHINLLIEFDGEYHYNPISFSKLITGQEQLKLTQVRDHLKTEYANKNGYKLLRIRYDDDIEQVLVENITRTPPG
jgi:Zn finger protein HypA/HybF involved in hydrogenase expression